MMQQQMMQQQGQQGAPSQEEQMMQQQQMQQQQAPQQGGQDEGMQQIMQFVQQAISQGMEPLEVAQLLLSKQVPPEVIMQVFVQVGLPEADAQTVIQQAMTSSQAEAGAEQPMQEGQPMPPEGQPSEQPMPPQAEGEPMPPQEQPPMGRGGMMYAEQGMAVNNEELDTIMSQVQEMLAQPNADIRAIMQEIQKAAQAGQISPETATTVLETLQQNMPSQTEPTQGMPSEEEMYAQQQMMQEQGQAGLARFGGNLRKLLKKAAGGSTNFPDDTSENYGEERTNSFLDAVKGNFFNAQLDDSAQQFPSLNGYAYGGEVSCPQGQQLINGVCVSDLEAEEIMADTNMYAQGGPTCNEGEVLVDGVCVPMPTEAQQVEQGVSSIDAMFLNKNNPNTVLTAQQPNNPNQQALNEIIDHNFKFNLDHGKRNRFTADINNKGQGSFDYSFLPSESGIYGGIGAGSDLIKKTNAFNLNAGTIIPNVLGSTLDINGNLRMEDQNAVAAFNANLQNKNGFGASAGYTNDGGTNSWNAGVSYNRDGTKTTPNIKVGFDYYGSAIPQTQENGGLVKAADGISMKDGKLVVDPSQYKDADSYELAYRRWNADPKNAKFLVDPKTNPYKTVTPYTFKDTDPGIVMVEGTPRINPAKYKTDAEYKAAIFDWNKKNKGTANVIDVDKISDFIPLPPEKEKKVEFQDGKKYTYDAKTKSWAEDLGTPALNFSAEDWASFTQPQRDAMNVQQKQLDAFKKNIENVTNQGIQPVGYNQPNAAFLNPWARFFMGGMERNQGVKTNVSNLPPGFDLNTSLKAGMRGETVGEDGKKYAWRVTSQEKFKKRVPGLFNNERGVRLNIEWGEADDKGNIIKKDNAGNEIKKEQVEIAQDPKDKTNNIPVISSDPKIRKMQDANRKSMLDFQKFADNLSLNKEKLPFLEQLNQDNFNKNTEITGTSWNGSPVYGDAGYQNPNNAPKGSGNPVLIKDKNGNVVIDKTNTPTVGTTPIVANNQVVDYNQDIPNGMMIKYGTDKDGNPIGVDRKGRLRGNDIERQFAPIDATVPIEVPVQPNNYLQWNPMGVPPIQNQPTRNAQDDPSLYELKRLSDIFNTAKTKLDQAQGANDMINSYIPYSEDPNIPIGNVEMPYAFDNVQPSQQDVINAMQMQNKIKNRPFARGGNVYEIGGQPPCGAGEAVDPNTGLCMDASTLGVRNNESNFRSMYKNIFKNNNNKSKENLEKATRIVPFGKPQPFAGPIDPFKDLEATESDDINVMPKMPTISTMNAFNNSFGAGSGNSIEDRAAKQKELRQGEITLSDEKTWQQKANQRENLADGLYGTAGMLTNFFNKARAINPDMQKAFYSSLNQPMTAQSDQSRGLYADNGDLLADQIGNQVLNPTYSTGTEQIVASPGLTFSKSGGNIFEYGGNIYELGGDIELTDDEVQQLAASGFYFEPA